MEHTASPFFTTSPPPSLPLSELGPDFAKTSPLAVGKKFETDEGPLGGRRQKLLARSFHILHRFISIRFKWWPRVSAPISFWSKILDRVHIGWWQIRRMGGGAKEFVQQGRQASKASKASSKLQGHHSSCSLLS